MMSQSFKFAKNSMMIQHTSSPSVTNLNHLLKPRLTCSLSTQMTILTVPKSINLCRKVARTPFTSQICQRTAPSHVLNYYHKTIALFKIQTRQVNKLFMSVCINLIKRRNRCGNANKRRRKMKLRNLHLNPTGRKHLTSVISN